MSTPQYVEMAQFREVLERLDQRIDNRINQLTTTLVAIVNERNSELADSVGYLHELVRGLDTKMQLVLTTYGLDPTT